MKKSPNHNYYTASVTYEEIPVKNWYLEEYKEVPDSLSFGECNNLDALLKEFANKEMLAKKEKCSLEEGNVESSLSDCVICLDKTGIILNIYSDKYAQMSTLSFNRKFTINPFYEILYQAKKHDIKKIRKTLEKYMQVKTSSKGKLNLVTFNMGAYQLSEFEIKSPKIDFKTNYNDDFEPIYKKVLKTLSMEKGGNGIVLFYGKPGTGKTTLIRHLINNIEKKILYIPTDLAHELAQPSFISFLKKHQNAILIIEDAENVLMKRTGGNNQVVSNLLNISDGLLGDCLNVQIVATFNTKLREIDEAFLRKGRIIAKYEFTELEKSKANKLASKLGTKLDPTANTTLSEIYNSNEESFVAERKKIGFKMEEE